jgi:hypothetical protein
MKLPRLLAIAFLGLCVASLPAEDKSKLGEHPFFKHFVGSWKSSGELKAADGNTVKIVEEWTCKVNETGELVIDGTRDINDQGPQKYRWSITHNPTTDLYEAVQGNPDDNQNAMRFEGNVSGTPAVFELKSQFGNGGGSATVTDTFTGDGYDAFDTKIVLANDSGVTTLEGVMKNERVK